MVREADPDTFIVAEAFSCRSQIKDGSEREPMHTVQLLQCAFRKSGVENGRVGDRARKEKCLILVEYE